MNKLLTLLCFIFAFTFVFAQEEATPDAEKVSAEDKDNKKKKRDDADIFISTPENSEDFQIEDRRQTSKPLQPLFDVDQEFNSQKKKAKQQEAFNNNEYYFPAKPKNAWSIGVNGGIASVNGDVSQHFFGGAKPFVPGYTFGAYVKKPFSYMFSLRTSYQFMEMYNMDSRPSTITDEILDRTGLGVGGYEAGNRIFHNTTTVSHDLTLDAVITFGNMKFHKERSKVVFNVFASAGAFMYRTWMDHFDDDGNPYDYNSLPVPGDDVSRKDVIEALNDIRNGVYETAAEGSDGSGFLGYTVKPVGGVGFGFTFRLSRILDLDLETRMMFTKDDLLDGHRWQEPSKSGGTNSRGLTGDFDTYSTTTIGLNFKLVGKKKTEPTTLLNPMHYTYAKLAEADPDRVLNELMKDEDGDGVPDLWDEEPDTPEGAPVDPKGKALDSDGDGIIDLNDLEPFSQPGYPVDEQGVAIKPEPDTRGSMLAGAICSDIETFPSIHFAKDKYYISPEFYAHLHTIAEKLILCDELKIVAIGTTDKDYTGEYNDQLSWNRVNAAVSYITENYGIDRNRFIVRFEGKENATGKYPIEQYKERRVYFQPAKSGETGSSNPEAPFPNIKAGSDK